jgi:hypothetical protein
MAEAVDDANFPQQGNLIWEISAQTSSQLRHWRGPDLQIVELEQLSGTELE